MQSENSEKRLPRAEVIVFPFDRRVGRVDSLARQILFAQTEAQAVKRWHTAVSRLQAELIANGFDQSTLNEQISRLEGAVKCRVWQLRSEEDLTSNL
ncbi:DUF6074 family protein [Roseibium album]|uniref:DUF6074 family protein n=1 Tax=Roseibium album TaxID=311410 RepID=UPI0024919841|nr:DUF6074 family protein [Roseibium album]